MRVEIWFNEGSGIVVDGFEKKDLELILGFISVVLKELKKHKDLFHVQIPEDVLKEIADYVG